MTDIWLCPVPANNDVRLCPIGPHVTPAPSAPITTVRRRGLNEGAGADGGFATSPQYWYSNEEAKPTAEPAVVWPEAAHDDLATEARRKRRRRAAAIAAALFMLGD